MIKKLFQVSSLRYVMSSVTSWVVDNGIFMALYAFLGTTVVPQIIARVISSFYNFNVNRYLVFKCKDDYFKSMIKYYCVCVPQTLISIIVLHLVVTSLSVSAPLLATLIKIIIEGVLFVASYFIQKKWVFM